MTWRSGNHVLQRPDGMVTIFRMNEFKAIPPKKLFRVVSENLGGGRTPVQYFAVRIDQRDGIGTVFDKRLKSLE